MAEKPIEDVITILRYSGGGEAGRIAGAVWLPVGTVVELGEGDPDVVPTGAANRDAVVQDVRLRLDTRGRSATVLVTLDDPEPGEIIPSDPSSRLLRE